MRSLKIIDLRSDTVTRPTPQMRRAIAEAEVGDDVFDDDPTVHRLQEVAAARLGKEAALFVPSGTMSNAIAIKTHTRPGDEILLDDEAHSMLYEVGLPAAVAQVLTRPFTSRRGVPDVEQIDRLIHAESLHEPGTALLVLENTHNRAGGAIIPLEVHQALWQMAQERNIRVHLDGARLFNAAVATGIPAAEYAACADTVTFCLSKGLGCPVGSVLCGTQECIARARRVRKMLGGGMRQAGILAAAGLYALEHHVERLAEDHRHARRLAHGIAGTPGITLDTVEVPTNMVYFNTRFPAETFTQRLAEEHRVLCAPTDTHRIRLVTHLDIDGEDVERAIAAIQATGAALS
ncbi:MAG TPA: low-specificity L-threonine aldolase [Chthonomonadaceae bacterium]|nr:low-specificity L-threonine aldolase [Chthonomonadaceae bacterium]